MSGLKHAKILFLIEVSLYVMLLPTRAAFIIDVADSLYFFLACNSIIYVCRAEMLNVPCASAGYLCKY